MTSRDIIFHFFAIRTCRSFWPDANDVRENVSFHIIQSQRNRARDSLVISHRDYRSRRVSVRDVMRGKSRGMTSSSFFFSSFFSSSQSSLEIRTCAELSPNTRFLTSGPPRRARSLGRRGEV